MTPRFPIDAPRREVLRAFERLGFYIVRDREHTALARDNIAGTRTTLTLPGDSLLNSGTLHRALAGCGIRSAEFIRAYYAD